jgi:hypothetical protein
MLLRYLLFSAVLVSAPASARLVDITLGNLLCPDAFTIRANTIADPQLNAAEFMGDFNGDGRSDIVLGSPQYDPIGFNNGGRGCVVFRPNPCQQEIDLAAVDNGFGGFCVHGDSVNGQLGIRLTPLGDINGDGKQDVAFNDLSFRSSIVFGRSTSIVSPLTPATLNGTNGFTIGRQTTVPAPIGDFNGDGIDDFAVGLISPARLCVLFGMASGWPASIDPSSAYFTGSNGFCMTAPAGANSWAAIVEGLRRPAASTHAVAGGDQSAYLIGTSVQSGGLTKHGLLHHFPGPYPPSYAFAGASPFTTFDFASQSQLCYSAFGEPEVAGLDVPLGLGCWAGTAASFGVIYPSVDALRSVANVNLLTAGVPPGGMRVTAQAGRDIESVETSVGAGAPPDAAIGEGPSGFASGATHLYVFRPLIANFDGTLDPAVLEALSQLVYSLRGVYADEPLAQPKFAWIEGRLSLIALEREGDGTQLVRVVQDVDHVFTDCVSPTSLGFENVDRPCPP